MTCLQREGDIPKYQTNGCWNKIEQTTKHVPPHLMSDFWVFEKCLWIFCEGLAQIGKTVCKCDSTGEACALVRSISKLAVDCSLVFSQNEDPNFLSCLWQYTVEVYRIHVMPKRNVRKQNRFTAVYPILQHAHLFSLKTKTKKMLWQ